MKYADLKALLYGRLRPKGLTFREVAYRGSRFLVLANEDVGWRLLVSGEYEDWELDALSRIVQKDDTCVDVGANIGIYSVLMAKMASGGQVHAFEPVPLNGKILALNLEVNRVRNVQIHGCVLSEAAGPVEFSVSSDGAYSSIKATGQRSQTEVLALQAVRLDDLFFRERRRVDLIKIDVEGAELMVLRGGHGLLGDEELRPKALLVELNPHTQSMYDYTPMDVVGFLKGFGYQARSITGKGVAAGWPVEGGSENALFLQSNPRG